MHGNYPTLEEANADRDYFIAEGWCTADEITVTPRLDMEGKVMYAEVKVDRQGERPKSSSSSSGDKPKGKGIRSSYSKIPLNIMVKETRKQGLIFSGYLDDAERVPQELSRAQSELESYATGSSKTDASHWRLSKDTPAKSAEHNYADDYSEDNNFFGNPEDAGAEDKEWLKKLRHDYLHISARMQPGHDPRIEVNESTGKPERTRKPYHG